MLNTDNVNLHYPRGLAGSCSMVSSIKLLIDLDMLKLQELTQRKKSL